MGEDVYGVGGSKLVKLLKWQELLLNFGVFELYISLLSFLDHLVQKLVIVVVPRRIVLQI